MPPPYADELIHHLERFSSMDLSNTLNFRMQIAVRDALLNRGMGQPIANKLSMSLDIDLAEDSLTQAQFERIAELEAGLLVTLSEMYLKEGFSLQEFCTQTRHMTLT